MKHCLAFALVTTTMLSAALGCGGDCPCANPPPIGVEAEQASGDERPEPAPEPAPQAAPSGRVTEADAVNIAISLAEAEGYDTGAYNDVVVVPSPDSSAWLVQMRRPHVLRFIEVTVPKRGGDATLNMRSSSF